MSTVSGAEGFIRAQRLAYEIALEVAGSLAAGVTEREAAARLESGMRARGVTDWLHRPFAWFGERSRFTGMRGFRDFLPSDRRLKKGEAAILDLSPVVEGCISDVGYSFSLGANAELGRARAFLADLRAEIPALVEGKRLPREVWAAVEERMRGAGYDNCYRLYPFSVLGHSVGRVSARRPYGGTIPLGSLSWFGRTAYEFFAGGGVFPLVIGPRRLAALADGFWAIEPHLGASGVDGGFGAKFEEILIVENGRARWLDDAVPHTAPNLR